MTLGVLGAGATLPGTIELGALTAGALLSRLAPTGAAGSPTQGQSCEPCAGMLAVIVPAHDEAAGIATCVTSLLACTAPAGGVRVVVIADNCTDDTAERARAAGAEVLERHDTNKRGKGFALEFAFEEVLGDERVEAVLVVDADTTVAPNFLTEMSLAFGGGADGVQCRYLVGNPDVSRLRNVALLAFNVARPSAREWLGTSVGILGNGFGLHRRVLARLPYTARSVVEDLEYHLMMVQAGYRVRFVDRTSVTADLPTTAQGEETQRARWEGGRYRMIRDHVPNLLRRVLSGKTELIEPLGELLLLPIATHVGLLLVVLVIPFPPTQLYALGALGLVAAHVGVSLYVGGGTREDVLAVLGAPLYVLRKLGLFRSIARAARRDQDWVRTERA